MSNKAVQVDFLLSGVEGAELGTATFYSAGTTTLKTIWLDRNKATPAANPYTLSATGGAQLYADGIYKVVIKNAAGTTLYTYDNMSYALSDGPWVDVAEYANLTAAVTAIGATETDLLIDSATTLTANTIVPTNIRLKFTRKGSANQGAYTLTINGAFEAGPYQVFTGTGTVSGLKEARPEWWATNTTPGTTDMGTAIKAALNAAPVVKLQTGKYATTVEIPIINGRKLIGSGITWWQDSASPPTGSNETIIVYTGAGGANTAAIRMSTEVVGTKPTYPTGNNFGVGVEELIIDGNNLAEIGLYSARSGLGSIYRNIVATGTKKHGFWFGEFWTCKVGEIYAIHNYGRGVTIGESVFWAANIVNAIEWGTVGTFNNGRDKTFNDTSAKSDGCGVAFFGARSNIFNNLIVEDNDGAGLYWSPISGPNQVNALYMELNGTEAISEARAARGYGVYVDATTSNVQAHFQTLFKGGATDQYVYLGGTMTTNSADGMVFTSMFGGVKFYALWGNYRLENPASSTVNAISGHFPANSEYDSLTPSPGVTTLYVDDTATGEGSGRDVSNMLGSLSDALNIAKIVTTVTTIDMSAVTSTPSAARTLDGAGLWRRINIIGGTTGRFNAVSGTAVTFQNFVPELTVSGMAVIERSYIKDSRLRFQDNPVMRMDTSTTAGAAVNADNSNIEIGGTSVINVSGSGAATKIGISVAGNSHVVFANAAAGTITGHTANRAIDFDEGAGIVQLSLTTATATWGVAVTYNADGESGMVQAPNGIKVGTGAGAFL